LVAKDFVLRHGIW